MQRPILQCPVCGQVVSAFTPYPQELLTKIENAGFNHSWDYWETFSYKTYFCPVCSSSDRDRLYALFLLLFAKHQNDAPLTLLDFAPSPAFRMFISAYKKFKHRTADLLVDGYDDKIDITNMHQYSNGLFDSIICSHVLEHVEDDDKAFKELYRVLRTGGFAIMMTPISLYHSKTQEFPNAKSKEDRLRLYGQDDHVRYYSKKDFSDKITAAGFKLRTYGIDFFSGALFYQSGLSPTAVLYVGEK